jgi:hypothetical protein
MLQVIVVALVLLGALGVYQRAKQNGIWSNKQFFVVLLAALALFFAVSAPLIFLSPATLDAHPGLVMGGMLLVIFAGVLLITIYANRWKKRQELKRATQGRIAGAALLGSLLLGAGASAQTSYRHPSGNFSLTVPVGWQIETAPQGFGVRLTEGYASVIIWFDATKDGSTPQAQDLLADEENEFHRECRQPQGTPDRGRATLAGMPGLYAMLYCGDPQGGTWTVSLAVAASNGKMLAFELWVPYPQYPNVKPDLDTMVQTLRLAGAAPAATQDGWTNFSAPRGNTTPTTILSEQPAPNQPATGAPIATPPVRSLPLSAAAAAAANVPAEMQTVGFDDPQFGVNYFTTAVPAGWFFQGGMVRGDPCEGVSSPFFRVNSPNGLSGFKIFPRLDLGWSNNPNLIPRADSGCLPYGGDISAAGYLQYLMALLHVNFVRDVTDPAEREQVRNQMLSNNPYHRMTYVADYAVALATFNINGIAEDEKIAARVHCDRGPQRSFCTIFAAIAWAPQGQIDPVVAALETAGNIQYNPQWTQLWTQYQNAKTAAAMAASDRYFAQLRATMTNYYNTWNQQTIANGEAFRQQLNNQYQIHEQQIATMNRSGDMAMARALANVNAQSRMAADVCDYALGVQKRLNPVTGETYKTDSNFSYDWVNSQGQHVLTDYINDNPNGVNGMDWVLNRNVHN